MKQLNFTFLLFLYFFNINTSTLSAQQEGSTFIVPDSTQNVRIKLPNSRQVEGYVMVEKGDTLWVKTREYGLLLMSKSTIKSLEIIGKTPKRNPSLHDSTKNVLITIADNQQVKGEIVENTGDTLRVQTQTMGLLSLPTKQVKLLQYDDVNAIDLPKQRPFGINLNLGGPSLIASVNLDYFLSKNISFEAGGGLFGVYGGAKLYIPNGKTSFYFGYSRSIIVFGESGASILNYLPFGIYSIDKHGYNFAFEVAAMGDSSKVIPWAQLRLGYRFKQKH